MIQWRYRKLYDRLDEGMSADVIVGYGKMPHVHRYKDGKTRILQYRKAVIIDLWLFMVRITWLTREKE